MCGIAGICNYKKNPIEDISAMNAMLIRRGPDSGDYWLEEKTQVVLGHRRLSIVELSEAGSQPMISHSGRYVIVFNGEIYNHNSLRIKMEEEGHAVRFRGTSDTEVLLEAIEYYGLKRTLQFVKGMFALAVYDREQKFIYLARDRVGEKPLYYGTVSGQFVFASDIAAIKALPEFKNSVNEEVLGLYLHYGYIPQPYSIYKDIWQLKPGTFLKAREPFEEWESESYWDICEVARKGQTRLFAGTEEEAAEQLEKLLRSAIKEQMVADVPLGAFLSGGIDSTLVVSLMQEISTEKIRTFTVGFHEKGYNEATHAKETAKYLGTEHTELYVGFSDVMDILPHLPEAYAEPFADSSQIPTMLVSKLTRGHVTVSLSGDAGDEFFCGYNTYKDMEKGLRILSGKAGFLPHGIRTGIGKVCKKLSGANTPLLNKVGKCFTTYTPVEFYRAIKNTDCRIPYLGKSKIILPCSDELYVEGGLKDGEHEMMLMDMLQYLPDDILVKVDRAGMYYSLESRIPLLDKDVIEFAWTLPLSYKYNSGITKKPLRNILYKYVPQEMMERPKKGFSVPVGEWLIKGEMHEWAIGIMADARNIAGEFLNLKYVDAIWKDYVEKNQWNPVIWYILVLEQWLLYNRIS